MDFYTPKEGSWEEMTDRPKRERLDRKMLARVWMTVYRIKIMFESMEMKNIITEMWKRSS